MMTTMMMIIVFKFIVLFKIKFKDIFTKDLIEIKGFIEVSVKLL